jgi:hypothetical protein
LDIRRLGARPRFVGLAVGIASVALSGLFLAGAAFAASSTVTPVSSATTAAWVNGKTVTIQYAQNYFCDKSVSSGAASGCELGQAANVGPVANANRSTLYVLVPLFTPSPAGSLNLQCPNSGNCVNHPMTLDLSRVFGAGTANAALPPHSHILDGPVGGWWDIQVVGVPTRGAWDTIANGKDQATMFSVIHSGGAVGPIPTNLYLFFNVVGQ